MEGYFQGTHLLKSSPKFSEFLLVITHYKKMYAMKYFFEKSSNLEKLPMNRQVIVVKLISEEAI